MTEQESRLCELHGPYLAGVIRYGQSPPMYTRCPKCISEADEAEKKRAERTTAHSKRTAYHDRYPYMTVPARYRALRMDTITQRSPEQLSMLARVAGRLKNAPNENTIISGAHATGKTYLMCSVLNAIMMSTYGYTTMADMVSRMMDAYRDRRQSVTTTREAYRVPDLLVIDDVAGMTDHQRSILHDVIDGRHVDQRATIIMTHLTPESLRAVLGDRIVGRLRAGGASVILLR